MPVADKWTQAFFNAVCPRTAGFSSVDLAGLGVQTLLLYLILMWIGGGSQSTAGGIKVNAFCCGGAEPCGGIARNGAGGGFRT